jgi:hypothetical protein
VIAAGLQRQPKDNTVRTESQPARRRLESWIAGLSLNVAILAGCAGSSDVQELPEAAKKTLVKRKVDFEPRTTKSSNTGQGPLKGRPTTR